MQAIRRAGVLWLPLLLLLPLQFNYSRGSNAGNSSCRTPQHMSTLLSRQRRYLIFQKGSTIIVQGNIAKAILGTMPRGLNELTEWTWTYELPASIETLWHIAKHKRITTTTTTTMTPIASWQHWPSMPWQYKKKWLKKQYINKKVNTRPLVCTSDYRQRYFQQPMCKASWQHYANGKKKRRRFERAAHSIILDLLGKWAELHAYQPRYCIMRALCESHHLLAPPGRSLFHDVIRICLRYAMPYVAAEATYTRAYTSAHSLRQCATLYGPHCRHSFLAHFTKILHG